MTIIDIITTVTTSSLVASVVTFLLKQYFDRRLEFHFNSKLEELKADLAAQNDLTHELSARRLELYPRIVELIYRLRNLLREVCQSEHISTERSLSFIRCTKEFIEQIYMARLDLERDNVFRPLHDYKEKVVRAENFLLDWIYLNSEKPSSSTDHEETVAQLHHVYELVEHQHRLLIRDIINLTTI